MKKDKLFSPREFAEFTGICKDTLATWRRNGRGPNFIKAEGKNGAIFYTMKEWESWKSKNIRSNLY